MLTLIRSSDFDKWLLSLKDQTAKARIFARLKSAAFGNFGDVKPVGEGILEMRIHYGPGYRIYYTRSDNTVYILLTGGDKSSQSRDIKYAQKLVKDLKFE
jgi:putative addiction module killer protein